MHFNLDGGSGNASDSSGRAKNGCSKMAVTQDDDH
jgi:hypothetical protein